MVAEPPFEAKSRFRHGLPCFSARAEMMRFLALFLMLAPLTAAAQCGFVNSDEGMTIVVGKGDKRCFSSPEFRENFRSNLVASVKAMEVEEARTAWQRRAFDERSATGEKLWKLAERKHAAAGGRYFGQR
jgi:hypothetical protein